MPPNY